jgi:hypothetical protein
MVPNRSLYVKIIKRNTAFAKIEIKMIKESGLGK